MEKEINEQKILYYNKNKEEKNDKRNEQLNNKKKSVDKGINKNDMNNSIKVVYDEEETNKIIENNIISFEEDEKITIKISSNEENNRDELDDKENLSKNKNQVYRNVIPTGKEIQNIVNNFEVERDKKDEESNNEIIKIQKRVRKRRCY